VSLSKFEKFIFLLVFEKKALTGKTPFCPKISWSKGIDKYILSSSSQCFLNNFLEKTFSYRAIKNPYKGSIPMRSSSKKPIMCVIILEGLKAQEREMRKPLLKGIASAKEMYCSAINLLKICLAKTRKQVYQRKQLQKFSMEISGHI
jgi:hypothetical protein